MAMDHGNWRELQEQEVVMCCQWGRREVRLPKSVRMRIEVPILAIKVLVREDNGEQAR